MDAVVPSEMVIENTYVHVLACKDIAKFGRFGDTLNLGARDESPNLAGDEAASDTNVVDDQHVHLLRLVRRCILASVHSTSWRASIAPLGERKRQLADA